MPLDASEQQQLTIILILAISLFILASALPQKIATIALLLLMPFQTIETRFGTSSIVLAYVVFIAMLLRKEQVRLPMLPNFLIVIFWYLVSMSLMPPSTYIQHAVYMFAFLSAILVFWLCYDLANRLENFSGVLTVFVTVNVLICIYCAVQLWIGPGERLVLFGISEMNMTRVRADGRLTGPFESAEITAQYFVLMEFIILYQLSQTTRGLGRVALILLALINVAFLVATGSRGEFLVLIGGAVIYLWLFRQRLGPMRALGLAVGGSIAVTIVALVVVNFTQFGALFDRIQRTEFDEQGIPDTRQVLWPTAWAAIKEEPVFGHGPRFRFFGEHRGIQYDDHEYIEFPHSLYLFLLYTVGFPGLMLFLWLLITIALRCWRTSRLPNAPPEYVDFARIGVIVIILFLVDGIKIDQMRLNLSDYWHFFFGLCGVFIAVCDKIKNESQLSGLGEENSLGKRPLNVYSVSLPKRSD